MPPLSHFLLYQAKALFVKNRGKNGEKVLSLQHLPHDERPTFSSRFSSPLQRSCVKARSPPQVWAVHLRDGLLRQDEAPLVMCSNQLHSLQWCYHMDMKKKGKISPDNGQDLLHAALQATFRHYWYNPHAPPAVTVESAGIVTSKDTYEYFYTLTLDGKLTCSVSEQADGIFRITTISQRG